MASETLHTRELLRGEITFDGAIEEEHNMLQQLCYPQNRLDFLLYILQHKSEIEANVACHLGLSLREKCRVSHMEEWIHGSFNLCVPIDLDKWIKRPKGRVIIRFPLPYKTGESYFPGNADEKLRCEVATYAWIQGNCPDVPTPKLWGFAFSSGQSFTAVENTPILTRVGEYLRGRLRYLLGDPTPCQFIRDFIPHVLTTGYMLLDCVEAKDGIMLSESWEEFRHDKHRRTNLFKDLSRIILSLGRTPLPRIGSMTIDENGVLSLTNRPLTLQLQQLENERIPTNINRDATYTAVEPYLLDLLACHDSRLLHQPNSVNDEGDCRAQMAALTCMRAVLHHFISRDLRHGPFLYTLTDIHQSNIFVDNDWHITFLIDLEWACSLPMEMQHPPHWLTNLGVDELTGEELATFDVVRQEFMDAFENEERASATTMKGVLPRTDTMKKGWDSGSFWYFRALNSTVGLFSLFCQHIQLKFACSHLADEAFDRIVSSYWSAEADKFVTAKMEERKSYEKQLRSAFKTVESSLSF